MKGVGVPNEQSSLELLRAELEKHLQTVRCPVHGLLPRELMVYGDSVYDMHFCVDGCCDRLADAMLESIAHAH
jgi:hypothetical protein